MSPLSGDTPDATAKAIANGKPTIPTTMPDKISFDTCFLSRPDLTIVKNFGRKTLLI